MRRLAALVLLTGIPAVAYAQEPLGKVVIGSKAFTESVILGELATQLAQQTHTRNVEHRQQLGGSTVLWEALKLGSDRGGIDLYPEYTGTLKQELLDDKGIRNDETLRHELAKVGILMSRPLGFNNTYALGMKEEVAARSSIRTISDLKVHPDLKFGFSNEFMERGDGWPSLRSRYGLPQKDVRGLEHSLAYSGLESGAIDLTELYSTDAEIRYHGLRVLQDDLHHFPNYYAVFLYRRQLLDDAPDVVNAILQLEGRIPGSAILEMNARARPLKSEQRVAETQVAADFLAGNPFFRTADEDEGIGVAQGRREPCVVGVAPDWPTSLSRGYFAHVGNCRCGSVGHCGVASSSPRPGNPRSYGNCADDTFPRAVGLVGSMVGSWSSAGHCRPVSLQLAADRAKHLHRIARSSSKYSRIRQCVRLVSLRAPAPD